MRLFVAVLLIGMVGSLLTNMPSTPSTSSTSHNLVVDGPDPATEEPISTPRATMMSMDSAIQLERKGDGHFYVDVEINGTPVTMLVDTGATGIALSREDARKAGIPTSIGMNEVVGRGADGAVHGEFATIDRIALGEKSAEQMPVTILNGGEQSLLGQEFLRKFASVEIRGDTMTLR